jgi:hypothetical protein
MVRFITAASLLAVCLVPASARAADVPPATPKASCGPGSLPEPGIQGRVPKSEVDSGAAAKGYHCNVKVVGHSGETGGFKVLRYVDKAGHECAYYDTTLLYPTNTFNLSLAPTGVAVLDMSDPAKPVRTASLVTEAMQTPHESVNISTKRGILAAVAGNPTAAPGVVDVYDISQDCRQPILKSSSPVGFIGHESGMAPDGNTFYPTSIGTGHTTAVDISNPTLPLTLGVYEFNSHGMTVSDDGLRGYMASGDGLRIVDLTEVQQRKPNPQVPQISQLDWPTMTIPQIAHPVTIKGKPYLVEVDEYSEGDGGGVAGHGPKVGAARIIDISDEKKPKVVSDIRLEVHQPEHRDGIGDDYGAQNPTQGYAAHYCGVPTRVEPTIMACSMILSGLRVFDIRNPRQPREIAYFVAPPSNVSQTGGPFIDEKANWAMSQPDFVPERNEIWYSDGTSGFWVLRLDPGIWPGARARCGKARVRLPRIKGGRIVRAVARSRGRKVAARKGKRLRALRVARTGKRRTVRITLRIRTKRGTLRKVTVKRRVAACA